MMAPNRFRVRAWARGALEDGLGPPRDEQPHRMWWDHVAIIDGQLHLYSPAQSDWEPAGTDDIPMQSTGLSDLNGREIFEADVLKHVGNGRMYAVEHNPGSVGLHPRIRGLRAAFVMCGGSTYHLDPKVCVVVGNCYEQPDLLLHVDNYDTRY